MPSGPLACAGLGPARASMAVPSPWSDSHGSAADLVADQWPSETAASVLPPAGFHGPVPARDSQGTPDLKCDEQNDGEGVWTYDVNHCRTYWVCHRRNDSLFHKGQWEWNEVSGNRDFP
jgi:hypothetical protein